MTRFERLTSWWRAVDGSAVTWGHDACSAWAARWVEAEAGVPVPLPVYGSESEAHGLIAAAGGLEMLWDEATRRAGLFETGAPGVGDVGLVATARFGLVGVIFGEGLAIWRATRGVGFLQPRPTTVLRAWRVPEAAR